MYGEKATELIRHITRDDVDIIPRYKYDLVGQVLKENDELYAENLRTSQIIPEALDGDDEEPSTSVDSINKGDEGEAGVGDANEQQKPTTETRAATSDENDVNSQTKEKNAQDNIDVGEKELMVMQVRHTAKLWNKRCLIAYHYERLNKLKRLRWEYGNNLPREIVERVTKDELEWFTKYSDNLFSYMSSLNDGKGLDLTLYAKPPKKLFIQVKCVRDYGQFDLEDGQPVMLKKDSIHFLPLSQIEKLIQQGVLEQTSL